MPDPTSPAAPANPAESRRRAAPLTQSREKLFYSISEAAAQLDVAAHVLRYWETQFTMLRPRKNRAGSRTYQPRDLELLQIIKTLLYDEGMTIAGARRKLQAARRTRGVSVGEAPRAAVPSPRPTAAVARPRPAPLDAEGVADAGQRTLAFAPAPGVAPEVAAVREALRELAASLRAPHTRRATCR